MSDAKKCSKCGEVKALDEFYHSNTGTFGRHAYCKPCAATYSKKRRPYVYAANRNREIARSVLWQKENSDRYKARIREWNLSNFENRKEMRKADTKRSVDKLFDGYVAGCIGICVPEAPPELLALKREQLAIKRMARELKQATKPTGVTQ